jgi:subtilisin family serine protease
VCLSFHGGKNVGGRLAAVQNDLLDWGLDRIDQPSLPEDGTYTYTSTGQRVRVFVLDSGLRLTHNEFQGPQPQHYQRAVCGFDKMEETDIPCQDLNNHGTMVAGIVGGETTGVAKKASIVSVKVMDKNRPWSVDVIEGLGYVLYQKQRHPTIPMVVMMAITFPRFFNATQEYFDAFSNHTKYSNTTFVPSAEAVATHNPDQVSAMDKITAELIAANVTVVVAAGNVDGGNTIRDSCLFSPITVPGVITVGATNKRDEVSSLSFTGPCVDLYAPGREITSANADDDESYAVSSGTSYAAPFVAGVAARMLEQNPSWTPLDITDAILENTIQTKEGLPLLNFVEASPPPQQQEQQQRPACRFVGLISDILCSNP